MRRYVGVARRHAAIRTPAAIAAQVGEDATEGGVALALATLRTRNPHQSRYTLDATLEAGEFVEREARNRRHAQRGGAPPCEWRRHPARPWCSKQNQVPSRPRSSATPKPHAAKRPQMRSSADACRWAPPPPCRPARDPAPRPGGRRRSSRAPGPVSGRAQQLLRPRLGSRAQQGGGRGRGTGANTYACRGHPRRARFGSRRAHRCGRLHPGGGHGRAAAAAGPQPPQQVRRLGRAAAHARMSRLPRARPPSHSRLSRLSRRRAGMPVEAGMLHCGRAARAMLSPVVIRRRPAARSPPGKCWRRGRRVP
jgi:hypothetical protein